MIVNVSSNVTTRYVPNLAAYAATKYALNALTLTARQELQPDGIVVSLIRPKLVQTEFGRRAIVPEPDSLRAPGSPVPIITPEEVAEGILALIQSEEAEAAV
jgi:short-subunit dehydrogenase